MTTANQTTPQTDVFAAIAEQRSLTQAGLIEPQPPSLPKRFLPSARSNPKAAFRPLAKLDTAEKLRRELSRERRRMAPFLRDVAPALPSARLIVPVESFDWRVETETDQRDFSRVLRGGGVWERVQIPHYGPPLGRAVTYYRTEFRVTRAMLAQGALFVHFKGVDYKAHVFVNGTFLGSHEGFFAPFEFECTAQAHVGTNTLVVKVENDAILMGNNSWGDDGKDFEGDKIYAATGPGYDDPEIGWHHCPPGMGIYQAVTIEARALLHIHDLFVRPLPVAGRAEAWIEVWNCTPLRREFKLQGSVFGQNFSACVFRNRDLPVAAPAGPGWNQYRIAFDLPHARLWDLDRPWLYQLQVRLLTPEGDVADTARRQFGMRSFRMDTDHKPRGRMFLNGREIRLRGANTMGFEQQDVMNGNGRQLIDDILLAKIGHLNFWRLTQRPVQDEIYDTCDRLGLLTQTDLPLFGVMRSNQFCEGIRQAGEMERLVRAHPCNVMASYINEPFPAAAGKLHRHLARPDMERFFLACDQAVWLANPDRVIKAVDGDYDPPGPGLPDNHCYCCWYNGHGVDIGKLHKGYWQRVKPDWLYGCGEFGAEGLERVALMRKSYPKAWLPQSAAEAAVWSPTRITRAQTGPFHYMFFDTPCTLDGWVAASQRHQVWATRIMTEAFRRDNRMNTMAIHLFIDAWPSGWMKTIMDVERQPKPAYFAYREALTPLMVNLRTDRFAYRTGESMRFECWVCNDTHATPGAQLRYQLEVDGKVVFAQQAPACIEACRSTFQGFLEVKAPVVAERTRAVLRLALALPSGKIVHDTEATVDLFPAANRQDAVVARVAVVGTAKGKAAQLARELGLSQAKSGDLYLVDDMACFAKRRKEIESAVQAGATAVFLEIPAGEYAVGGSKITVQACGMGARHFVSRNTGHPLVAGFQPEDFRMWYSPAADRVVPLLETTLKAEDWLPVLTSGNGVWGGGWAPALAAAERRHGKGRFLICQVALAGRTTTNPVADLFARRLVNLRGAVHGSWFTVHGL